MQRPRLCRRSGSLEYPLMKKRKISLATQSVLIICALLLVANLLLGSLLLKRSQKTMKTLINERMLDISNTAAAMVDGDALKNLTAHEEDTPEYRAIYDALRLFQDNIELEYIYTVRDMGNGAFIFLIDPAEENASEFGELVTVTDALKKASLGTPSVDEKPYQDQWGRFYSAYSPVRDSAGRIVGLVCVDFRADWYDEQLSHSSRTVLLFSVVSLAIGASVALAITAGMRGRLRTLNEEFDALSDDVDALMSEIAADAGVAPGASSERKKKRSPDELDGFGDRIRSMRSAVQSCVNYMRAQAESSHQQ